jgi:hypothetical protein
MAEIPVGYFPDVRTQWNQQFVESHSTEILTSRNGREQRRGQFAPAGYRRFSANSDAFNQSDRRTVKDFLRGARGRLNSFYFYNPIPSFHRDYAVGSVSAASRIIIPFTNSTITDVRVAGGSIGFTVNRLGSRPGWLYPTLKTLPTINQYVDAGSSATLRATGDQTITAWVKPLSLGTFIPIVSNETSNASGVLFGVNITTGTLFFRTNQAGAATSASSSGTVSLGQWSHVAVVRSGTGITFYVNGVAAGTGAGIANPVAATSSFRIGSSVTTAAAGDALLSDVRYFSAAIGAVSIAAMAAGDDPPPTTSQSGWWKLSEGTGTSVADSSGFANNGTLTGSPGPTWVYGEDEVISAGGPMTGAVTVTLTGRERMICRSDTDTISQSFIENASDVRAVFQLALKEVY